MLSLAMVPKIGVFSILVQVGPVTNVVVINPRCACAARVIVVVVCVCMYVCMCVCVYV